MSRFLYWTIVIGAEPTAFRAREAADLQPTLTQIRRKNPEAAIKWFQRGRLWTSPDEARDALAAERAAARSRPPTWRPGGTHEDPRQKYKDAKKAKWTRFKDAIRRRSEGRAASRPPFDAGSGDRPPRRDGHRGATSSPGARPGSPHSANRPPSDRPPRPPSDRPPTDRPYSSRPTSSRPFKPRSQGSRQGRPAGGNPHGPPPRGPRGPRGPRDRKGPGRR